MPVFTKTHRLCSSSLPVWLGSMRFNKEDYLLCPPVRYHFEAQKPCAHLFILPAKHCFRVSMAPPSPEGHGVGVTWSVAFSDWLLPSATCIQGSSSLTAHYFSALNDIPLFAWTTVCLSITCCRTPGLLSGFSVTTRAAVNIHGQVSVWAGVVRSGGSSGGYTFASVGRPPALSPSTAAAPAAPCRRQRLVLPV